MYCIWITINQSIAYFDLCRFLDSKKWLLFIPVWVTTLKSKQLEHPKIFERPERLSI